MDPDLTPLRIPVPRASLVVTETVYHRRVRSLNPEARTRSYVRELSSDDQSYVREDLAVGPEWVPIERGWIKKIGLLVVCNDGGPVRQVQPTDEERDSDRSLVVEIGFGAESGAVVAIAVVHPGEDARFTPADGSTLFLRSLSGDARVSYRVIPA